MILYVFFVGWKESMNYAGIFGFGFFVLLLFGCVLLHELGHALTARRYGVGTKDIIISPIGGIARLLQMPKNPWSEFWVAIMGPAVNVGIAIILAVVISITPLSFSPTGHVSEVFAHFSNLIPLLMWINIGLVIFNLIPAFPMDGGRVFRALLSLKWSPLQSTRIASYFGQTIAMGFIFYGLYHGEYILPFIGVFVFVTAALEYRSMKKVNAARQQQILGFIHPLIPLFEHDSPSRAKEILAESPHQHILVLDTQYNAVGFTNHLLVERIDDNLTIAEAMKSELQYVFYTDNIETVIDKFEFYDTPLMPVYSENHLLGTVYKKDILR